MKLQSLRRRLLLHYLVSVALLLVVAETLVYGLLRWAEYRELDTSLRKEIEKLSASVELEPDYIEIENKEVMTAQRLDSRAGAWQVLLENGRTLGRSEDSAAEQEDLPAVGGAELPLEEFSLAYAPYRGLARVRAARLLTVRRRLLKPERALRMPEQMVLDLRAVVDCTSVEARLQALAWLLAGSFPILLGLAAVAGRGLIRRAIRPVELAYDRERRFTGAASHELRTPLTARRGEIEVTLRRPRSAAEYVASLQRMEGLVQRMTGLVEGLLVLARADAGQLLLGASPMTVAELTRAIEEVVALLPDQGRVKLTCNAPGKMTLLGDHLLMALAVRNLVENALVHAGQGLVHVGIAVDDSDTLQVTVEDQGPGLPEDFLSALQTPNGNGALAERGTARVGLGLSITRAVVAAHGGRLHCDPRPPAGCRIVIALPNLRQTEGALAVAATVRT
jgi:signal transduction histidine kinase